MSLREELQTTLNRASAENQSGTPDFILAEYLTMSLQAFDKAVRTRDQWWGFAAEVGDTPFVTPDEGAYT